MKELEQDRFVKTHNGFAGIYNNQVPDNKIDRKTKSLMLSYDAQSKELNEIFAHNNLD